MKLAIRLLVMTVALLAVVGVAAAEHPGGMMYWIDAGTDKIQRANLNGSNVTNLVDTGLVRPLRIALDLVNTPHQMYWTDGDTDTIQRAQIAEDPVVFDVVTGASDRVSIALDLVSNPQKIYWTDFLGRKIKRANLDGTMKETLVNTQCCPVGIALDVGAGNAGEMYWTLRLGVDKIQRAPMLVNPVVTDLVTTGLGDVRGIALDLVERKMYWPDNGTDTINRAAMAVNPVVQPLVTSAGLILPIDIALDVIDGKMYWTDAGTNKIQRANMDGTDVVEDLVTGLSIPVGIALDVAPDPDLIADVVDGLPGSAFKAPGHKTAMLARLNAIQNDIEDGFIDDAKDGLLALRLRVDGCGTTADSNDWIVDCAAQLEIRALIDLLLANLGC